MKQKNLNLAQRRTSPGGGDHAQRRLTQRASIKWIRAYLECLFEARQVFVFEVL